MSRQDPGHVDVKGVEHGRTTLTTTSSVRVFTRLLYDYDTDDDDDEDDASSRVKEEKASEGVESNWTTTTTTTTKNKQLDS